MPIYEYNCGKCGAGFEHLARSRSDTPKKCPQCGSGRVSKQLSSFATTKTFQTASGCGGCAKAPACPAAGAAGGGGCCGGSCA
jgi:putative FmdB family regulatory protein